MRLRHVPTVRYATERGLPLRVLRDPATVVPRTPRAVPPVDRVDEPPREHFLPEAWWGQPLHTPEVYVAELDDAILFGGSLGRASGGFHDGGHLLVTGDGALLDDSFYVRGPRASLPRDLVATGDDGHRLLADVADAERVAGEHVLLGTLFPGHFGHCLTEGLGRAWHPRPEATYVVYEDALASWQEPLLEALGIERVLHVTRPMRFERLVVPSRACRLQRFMTPEMASTYGRIRDAHPRGPDRRVFLSRRAFTKRRRLVDEDVVEERFRARGFRIVYPEQLPFGEQVSLARGADVLAGTSGSNMYLAGFLHPGARCVVVSPRRFTPVTDLLISTVTGTELTYVFGEPIDDTGLSPRYADFAVDAELVEDVLDQL